MRTNSPHIVLEGSKSFSYNTKSCSSLHFEIICRLAEFVFKNPSFISLTGEIFLKCYSKEEYRNNFNDILYLNKQDYNNEELSLFLNLIRKFYNSISDIENNRGVVVEKLCDLAIQKKYSNKADEKKYHCKIHLHYENKKFSTSPHNIDVCGRCDKRGDYLEAKRGIRLENKKAQKKLKKLCDLRDHLTYINQKYSYVQHVYLFAFTENEQKISKYREVWPKMQFLGINDFREKFCY